MAEYIVRILMNDDCITEGELIRCRDCIRWRRSKPDITAMVCDWDGYERTEKDFCSWAKRREDVE